MKKYKKLFAVLLTAALTVSNLIFQPGAVEASGAVQPGVVLAENMDKIEAEAGSTITITIPVRAINYYLKAPIISIDEATTKAPVVLDSKFRMITKDPEKTMEDIITHKTTYISFEVKVKEGAKNGEYPLYLSFLTTDSYNNYMAPITLKNPVTIKVVNEKTAPQLSVKSTTYDNILKAGDKFNLKISLTNLGESMAEKVKISMDGFDGTGVLPNYTYKSKSVVDIVQDEVQETTFPLKVSKTATDGTKTVNIIMECVDSDGNAYKETTSVFIEVKGKKDEKSGTPNVIITNVTQSTNSPTAGERFTVSFYIDNRGSEDVKEIQIAPTNLTNITYTPDNSEPYIYIDWLKGKTRKKITMNLEVSDKVVEGLNELNLGISYKGEDGTAYGPLAAKLFIRNVLNPEDEGSTPKLIISEYKTSEENLKAGKAFDFTFDVQNTNSKVSARNIKVTLSSKDNVFSVTKGSNSFYIPVIQPGDKNHNVMNLKIKADSVTMAYPIEIKFEYEYEGMPIPSDGTISPGVSITEIINLQVMENSRPSVSNISIGYGEVPMIDTPTTLNFDFANLGKSVLSNVTARVESEGFEATSTVFIGNVEAGSMSSQEIAITPKIEGPVKGELIITYENSNGEAIDVPTSFDATVMPMQTVDPGMDPGMDPGVTTVGKPPIVPTWIFIIIQIVVFAVAIPIGRKITLGIYKRKMLKKEQEEF